MLSVPHPFIYESLAAGAAQPTDAEGVLAASPLEKVPAASPVDDTPREKTVLIVDDDPALRTTVALMLECRGFKALVASNGLEALDMIHGHSQICAVILDLLMPVMDGEETFRQLRQYWSDIPVIVISGFHLAEVSQNFATPPPEAFVQKPFTFESLIAALDRVLA